MASLTRGRPNTSAPGDGSRTMTITNDPTREEDSDDQQADPGSNSNSVVGSLRLRAGAPRTRQRVAWNEDVVDNEGCGKKKSKICCIYHKPRRFDESSDESDSDSDSDASSCEGGHDHSRHHNHPHHPNAGPSNRQQPSTSDASVVHELERSDDNGPNAYEKQFGSHKVKSAKRNAGA